MGYASRAGRARTSSVRPQAHAICDRCGARVNFVDLRWQMDWRGAALQNLRILVCSTCFDRPQEQLRAIVLPRDPDPIINARPENFQGDELSYMTTTPGTTDPTTNIPIPSTTPVVTMTGEPTTPQPLGPTQNPRSDIGLGGTAQMPLVANKKWAQPVPFLSIISTGTTIVAVTCSVVHGMSTNAQIAVEGTSDVRASGFYSVTVTGPMTFTYQTNAPPAAGSLTTGTTTMITANAGLPLGYAQIPPTGALL